MNGLTATVVERRAFDIYVPTSGLRLGFVVQLPDQLARHGNEWLAFTMSGELGGTPCQLVGYYAKPGEASDAIIEEHA